MKRIFYSYLTIGVVIATAIGASSAFFSDVEVSKENTFTAGRLDLRIDSQAHYDGMICNEHQVWIEEENGTSARPELISTPCHGTWELTDLNESHMFFSLQDIKPGDDGESTISMHVTNDDAYLCAIIDNMQNDDLGLTEPEQEDGDVTDGASNGELANEIHFFAWADDGDNVWEENENELFSNLESSAVDIIDGVVYPLFTPETSSLKANLTEYIGLFWCYGDIMISGHELSCDGAPVSNVSQTDSLSADISFYVEQARNNDNFTCPIDISNQIFFEDFDDGNAEGWITGASCSSPNWCSNGNWRIENALVKQDYGGDGHMFLLDNYLLSDHYVEAKMLWHDNGGVGLVVWRQDDDNWVMISYPTYNKEVAVTEKYCDIPLCPRDDNVTRTVFPYTISERKWQTLRVNAHSETGELEVYLDNVYLFTHTVGDHIRRLGLSGFVSGNAGGSYDDFKIETISNN